MVKAKADAGWKDLEVGAIICEPGSARQYKTGDWRSQRPVFDHSKCNKKCTICYMFCPEGCIERNAEGYHEANLDYCKGCGICAQECPRKVITMKPEED